MAVFTLAADVSSWRPVSLVLRSDSIMFILQTVLMHLLQRAEVIIILCLIQRATYALHS